MGKKLFLNLVVETDPNVFSSPLPSLTQPVTNRASVQWGWELHLLLCGPRVSVTSSHLTQGDCRAPAWLRGAPSAPLVPVSEEEKSVRSLHLGSCGFLIPSQTNLPPEELSSFCFVE